MSPRRRRLVRGSVCLQQDQRGSLGDLAPGCRGIGIAKPGCDVLLVAQKADRVMTVTADVIRGHGVHEIGVIHSTRTYPGAFYPIKSVSPPIFVERASQRPARHPRGRTFTPAKFVLC